MTDAERCLTCGATDPNQNVYCSNAFHIRTPTDAELIERLLSSSSLPSAFDFVGDKIEDLFDPGLRHKRGKKPYDYLVQWLSMLRPFAYATRDDSWGEMEKLLCSVLRNYVENKRSLAEAADRLTSLSAQIEELRAALEKISLEAHETIPPDGKAAAFAGLHQIWLIASRALARQGAQP